MTSTLPLWAGLAIVAVLLSIGPIAHAVRNWRAMSKTMDEAMEVDASE